MTQHMRNNLPAAATLALAACLASASGDATAVNRLRSIAQNATGSCQSALPVFDGQIRKRPLAVQNEGSASAFVTCSFAGTASGVGATRSISRLLVFADNNTDNAASLTCTLVDGLSGSSPTYTPKTIALPLNSTLNSFSWTAEDDNGGDNFFYTVNISCNLPVGTGLTLTYLEYAEDVGD